MWPPTITPCECQKSGWCPRHQCQKRPEWHLLCRLEQEYFNRWEAGQGPCLRDSLAPSVRVAALPACRERGALPVGQVSCELCGRLNVLLPVYECRRFGRCTESRVRIGHTEDPNPPVCLTCDHYAPSHSEPPPDAIGPE